MNDDGFELLSEKVDLIVEAVDSIKTDLGLVKADLNTKASTRDFERLFIQMQERFDNFERKLDEKASQKDMDRVLDILDHHTRQFDDIELEMTALSAKVDRYHPA